MTVTTKDRKALRKVTKAEVQRHMLRGRVMDDEVVKAKRVLSLASEKKRAWTTELYDLALRKLAAARRVKVKAGAFVLLPRCRVTWSGGGSLTWELKIRISPPLATRICAATWGEVPGACPTERTEVCAMLDEADFAAALETPRYASIYNEQEPKEFTMVDRGVNTPFLYTFRNEDEALLNGKFGVLVLARQCNGTVCREFWLKDSWNEAVALGVEIARQAKLKRADPHTYTWKLPEPSGPYVDSWALAHRLGYRD